MISFSLTTPERVAYEAVVHGVTLPTSEGEMTVLPMHIPLLAMLKPGVLTVHTKEGEEYMAVGGGFVQVQPFSAKASKGAAGTRVIVLADSADRADELTAQAVEAAHARAQKALAETQRVDDVAFGAAAAALERELARLKVVRKRRR